MAPETASKARQTSLAMSISLILVILLQIVDVIHVIKGGLSDGLHKEAPEVTQGRTTAA
jgi:hypothetical protein